MLAVVGIDEADQILGAELMVDVGDLNLPYLDRLRIVRDAAHHVEQRADGHVLPCRILRQPAPDRVIELELAGGFELEDQRGGEFLGVAADVEESVGTDRLPVAEPVIAGIDRKDRFARAAIHLQCSAGGPLDRPAILDISVKDLLQLRGDRRVIRSRGRGAKTEGAKERQSDEDPPTHFLSKVLVARYKSRHSAGHQNTGGIDAVKALFSPARG